MNRRQLLLGAVFATSLGPFAEARRFGGVGASTFALVAPSGAWTGTPGSGGTSPTDPTRSTAKPAAQWWQASQIRGVGPTLVGVMADAKGGISKVTFWVEGATQDASLVYYPDTDINGSARIRPMWGIKVDCAAAYAAHPTGVVRVYATVYPSDVTMQARVIGPMTIYPRAVAYDWDKTVNSGGGADYTSLATALQAMKTALASGGKECGRITITGNGTYDWGWPDSYGFPWSFGYSCVTVAPGVTATVARFNNSGVNAFDGARGGVSANNINDPWYIWSYVNNLEFRGAGLIIDRKNFGWVGCSMGSSGANYVAANNLDAIHGSQLNNGNFFFNGCKVTNTYGAWPQLYWNQGIPRALTPVDPNTGTAVVWGDGVTIDWVNGGQVFLSGDNGAGGIFTKAQNNLGTMHQGAHMTYGEYTANCPLSNEFLYCPRDGSGHLQGIASCTIQYVGSQTGATLNFTGSNLVFTVTGASPYTVTFQPIDPSAYAANMTASPPQPVTWNDIQAYMTANHPGDWSFSIPAGALCPFWVPNVDAAYQAWPQTNLKASPYTVLSSAAMHTEAYMWSGAYENVICHANTWTKCGFSTISFNVHDSNDKDFSFKNNTFDSGAQTGSGTLNTIAPLGSHMVFENNTIFDHFSFQTNGCDSYSTCAQNVFGLLDATGGYTGGGIPANCVAAGTPPTGTGCVTITGTGGSGWLDYTTQWTALFNSPSTGDWTPKSGSTLALNPFTIINPRDAQMAARAATDAAGAWKIGGSAPVWPF